MYSVLRPLRPIWRPLLQGDEINHNMHAIRWAMTGSIVNDPYGLPSVQGQEKSNSGG